MPRGIPDIMCMCPKGVVIFFEVKNSTGRLSTFQYNFHEKIKKLDHLVYVVRSIPDVERILNTIS